MEFGFEGLSRSAPRLKPIVHSAASGEGGVRGLEGVFAAATTPRAVGLGLATLWGYVQWGACVLWPGAAPEVDRELRRARRQ